jgi:hypothetical protein
VSDHTGCDPTTDAAALSVIDNWHHQLRVRLVSHSIRRPRGLHAPLVRFKEKVPPEQIDLKQTALTGARALAKNPRSFSDYHAAGKELLTLQHSVGGYGTAWIDEVIAALADESVVGDKPLRISRSLAYRLIKFAVLLQEDRVAELEGKVSWESIMHLLHLASRTRDKLLKRIVRSSDSPSPGKPLSTRAGSWLTGSGAVRIYCRSSRS